MRNTIIAFLASVLAACCGGHTNTATGPHYVEHAPPPAYTLTDTIPVYVDKDFSDANKREIKAALDEWNHSLNGYDTFTITDDSFDIQESVLEQVETSDQGVLILAVTADQAESLGGGDGTLAWVNQAGGHQLFVIVDRVGDRLHNVLLHELGHTLGLEHTQVRGTLMNPYYSHGIGCIDELTMRQLTEIRSRYSLDHLNYCVP